jgi:DNA-binding transcriptional LysR family regulator
MGDGRSALGDVLIRQRRFRRLAPQLPHLYAAMAVVARIGMAVTPPTLTRAYADAAGLAVLPSPVPRPSFTPGLVWPDALVADQGATWLRGLVRQAAGHV